MHKWLERGQISGPDDDPTLILRGYTGRGTGTEVVRARAKLKPLLLELASDRELRKLMLEAIIESESSRSERRAASVESFEADREVLEDWLDDLDPDELFVVLHRHNLGGVSYRYWFYGDVDDPSGTYKRALAKLPSGIGPVRADELIRRYRSSLDELLSDDE